MTHPRICQENATTGVAFLIKVHEDTRDPEALRLQRPREAQTMLVMFPGMFPYPFHPSV